MSQLGLLQQRLEVLGALVKESPFISESCWVSHWGRVKPLSTDRPEENCTWRLDERHFFQWNGGLSLAVHEWYRFWGWVTNLGVVPVKAEEEGQAGVQPGQLQDQTRATTNKSTNEQQPTFDSWGGRRAGTELLSDWSRQGPQQVCSLFKWMKSLYLFSSPPKLTMVIHFFDEQILSINWNHVKIIKVMKKQI